MTRAIILSGGWGTRLRPLTCTIPKTLIPIVNKPVIERQMLLLKSAGVKEVVLAVSVMDDVIRNYFKSGEKLGIKIHYTIEKHPRGTAGAMKLAESYLKNDNFFMLNGDVILNFDLGEMLKFHNKYNGIGTIAGKVVDDPTRYGVLIVNNDTFQLLDFLEKNDYLPPNDKVVPMPINAGVYILEPEIFSYIEADKKLSIEREVFPRIAKEKKIFCYPISGLWNDVGKPYDLLQANILLMKELINNLDGKVKNLVDHSADVHPSSEIYNPCTIGENVVIHSDCKIGPNVIIGDNVLIENKAELSNCLIYNEVYISNNVKIDRAIIADNCNIRENVIIKGNGENLVVLASFVEVLNDIELIAPKTISLNVCHHEIVKESMK
ncbi:MAG: sugar phosphate nucleotidyltransferase [Promethearchaeota archaeon]|jgi:NDP-sugar pyrophosphorylase family protein